MINNFIELPDISGASGSPPLWFTTTHKRETILTMAKYMVRVELHDADSKQYEILHERMESLGFY
ncbi:MAG: hypothetical protein RAM38_16090, partial [Arsenophonus sp.]|nr:hypothetical protein [Arsenophonus sp.]